MLKHIHSQSLQQLLSACYHHTRSLGFPALASVAPGDVIHIQGGPSTGKSQLLYYLIATCLLPRNATGGGWNKVALIYDVDGRFSISRLRDVLLHRLQNISQPSVENILARCLDNVHVFRPTSTEHLAVTLANISFYHASKFPNAEIGLLGVHSIDAYYWSDRFKGEQLQSMNPSEKKPTSYHRLGNVLKDIRSTRGYIIALSYWGLLHGSKNLSTDTSNIPRAPNSYNDISQFVPNHLVDLPITHCINLTLRHDEDITAVGIVHRLDKSIDEFALRITDEGVAIQ